MKKTVLLYNFNEEELPKVKRVLWPLKFFVKPVSTEELALSVGYLTGQTPDSTPKPVPEGSFGKLIVMSGFLNADLDKLLAAMRKVGYSKDVLKAVVTPTNSDWCGPQLYAEVLKEHKVMHRG